MYYKDLLLCNFHCLKVKPFVVCRYFCASFSETKMCISGWTKAAHIQDKNTIEGEIASGVCFYFIFPLISITVVLLIYIFVA